MKKLVIVLAGLAVVSASAFAQQTQQRNYYRETDGSYTRVTRNPSGTTYIQNSARPNLGVVGANQSAHVNDKIRSNVGVTEVNRYGHAIK
jgi:hypothetical protein